MLPAQPENNIWPLKPFRFHARSRLNSNRDFQNVFNNTECKSSDKCLTILAKRNTLGYTRLGVKISKRSVASAVKRNQIKRLIRESFRNHQSLLIGLDIIVLNRSCMAKKTNAQVFSTLERCWTELAKKCAKQ